MNAVRTAWPSSPLTNRCRTRHRTASLSPCLPLTATRLMPMFVPSANSTSSSQRRSTAFGTACRVATEVNSPVKPVADSAS